ncbi:hypothetical protein SUGI_0411700, partial [Cryptomeria japonica]
MPARLAVGRFIKRAIIRGNREIHTFYLWQGKRGKRICGRDWHSICIGVSPHSKTMGRRGFVVGQKSHWVE